ncbi:hypothetical protein [Psychrobium sp. 1_MG-2023]|uniref:hypothetical protein n=1 Tax=Psychrobium sp. 1_MG-2023 TaxID=3062624 RepID=UPI002686E843|nr:hypothetical protein [Psychrobium sp. 1_MG-2023]MDP2559737.1 hypothetical protein [Psychrobium sp. 1_MG-2023]
MSEFYFAFNNLPLPVFIILNLAALGSLFIILFIVFEPHFHHHTDSEAISPDDIQRK